jgi:hypothetical protein
MQKDISIIKEPEKDNLKLKVTCSEWHEKVVKSLKDLFNLQSKDLEAYEGRDLCLDAMKKWWRICTKGPSFSRGLKVKP